MCGTIKYFVAITFLACPWAGAHRPIFTDEKGVDSETAVKITSPEVSQVIYRILTTENPQLWLAIDAKKKLDLFVQIGIPVIDRLENYRPSFVVLGPGLPEISTPFSIPNGIGGKDFSTESVNKPRFFHEHFTKTDSWILRSETISIPASGRYYVVAYSPRKQKDKLWLSVGKKENFSLLDWLRFGEWKKEIQKFHETGVWKADTITIDDFSDPNNTSTLGTEWRLVTDRVMGGVSDGEHEFGDDKRFRYINLKGNVSLENNGGFVQVALPLTKGSKYLDATGFSGVRFWVKGNGDRYYVHLRNKQTRLPWQYYSAAFTASKNWEQIEIPFESFKPQALRSSLKINKLSRIAIAGAKKAYKINIDVGPIEFYLKKTEK